MKKRLLVLSVYPAPYRVELIGVLRNEFEIDSFFEYSSGDGRDKKWFMGDDADYLDNDKGKEKYHECIKQIKKYDLVILYDYSTRASFFLILRCIINHVPYVLNADGTMIVRHGNPLKEIAKRFFITHAVGYFASGTQAENYFLSYGAKKDAIYIHTFSTLHKEDVLSSPLNSYEKSGYRTKVNLNGWKRIVIAVGRFVALKRYSELIEAWSSMPDDNLLLIIGGGDEKGNYLQRIKEKKLNNVIIKDFMVKDQLMNYYRSADVFVHPTSYDVWGLVVNEAMANGLPVVVSNKCVAGLELIRNGYNGFLFETGQENVACQDIRMMLQDDELLHKMAVNSISTIKDYTIENMAKTQANAIKEILSIRGNR